MIECICRNIITKEVDAYAEEYGITNMDAFLALMKERGEGCGRCDSDLCINCGQSRKGSPSNICDKCIRFPEQDIPNGDK